PLHDALPILFGILDRLVDVVFAHVGRSGDCDALLLAGAEILRADMDNAVGVDIEGDLNLRHAARGRGDAVQMEGAEALVVTGKLTLALQNIDLHAGLVVSRSREDLALLGRDGGVAVNDLGADTAEGLDAKAQRGNVKQQQALDIALQHAALDRRADSDAFIGVDALERLAVELFLD